MTWVISKICHAAVILYSMRSSLKVLKKLSYRNHADLYKDGKDEAYGILMFWTIYAFYVTWESHFEFIIRWFPGYYYLKALFIIIIAIPEIKITHLIFHDFLVPLVDNLYQSLKGNSDSIPGAFEILSHLPIMLLVLIFPMLNQDEDKSYELNENNIKEIKHDNNNFVSNEIITEEKNIVQLDSLLVNEDLVLLAQSETNNDKVTKFIHF